MLFSSFLAFFSLISVVLAGRVTPVRQIPRTYNTFDQRALLEATICVSLAVGTTVDLSGITAAQVSAEINLLGLISLGLTVDTSAVGRLLSVKIDENLCLCAVSGTLTQTSLQSLQTYLASDTEVTGVVGKGAVAGLGGATLQGAINLATTGIVQLLGTDKYLQGRCPNNPPGSTTLTGSQCGTCDYVCTTGYVKCDGQCVPKGTCPSGVPGGPARRRRGLSADLICSNGLTACAVPGRKGKTECMNTASDVESCGGCEFPLEGRAKGVDCTGIPNVDAVACMGGRCVVQSCRKGFSLIGDECVALARK